MPRLTVGLTGGVASGKSLVESQFNRLGVPVLDADQVSRAVVAPGAAPLNEIALHFGPEFITDTGELDRRRMRERIFTDAAAKLELERILHPHIAHRIAHWRDAQTAPYCVVSIAILLESGMRTLVDRVAVVDVPVEDQLARLMLRDHIDEALARRMIHAQCTRQARLEAADDVILNDGHPDETRLRVTALHHLYLALAGNE